MWILKSQFYLADAPALGFLVRLSLRGDSQELMAAADTLA